MKHTEEKQLDKAAGAGTSDKIKGKVKEGQGHVEKAAGELTGDASLKHKGAKDEVAGKVQHKVGEAKEGVEKVLDKAKEKLHKH